MKRIPSTTDSQSSGEYPLIFRIAAGLDRDLINPETSKLSDGISTEYGLITVDINRSIFDGKMAAFLFGAGRASCQICSVTRKDLKDSDLVIDAFSINRIIADAAQIFSEIDNAESFFALHLMNDMA